MYVYRRYMWCITVQIGGPWISLHSELLGIARMCHMSEDTKQILLEFNMAIWFNKDCKLYNLKIHYIQIIINGIKF
jgi:hypothetical protein